MSIPIKVLAVWLLLPQHLSAETQYPACKAAAAGVDYGSELSIPQATRALIESYRTGWQNLCAAKGRNKSSLADLFASAKRIEADFKKIFEAFDDAIINEPNFDVRRFDTVNALVSQRYPGFVPAFKGAYGEHETFAPSLEAFRQSSALGSSEDRVFFDSKIPLESDFPPFILKTWEYGGCDRFGEFDWVGAMKGIARVKKQVRSPAFLQETAQFEDKLFRELSPAGGICTCKETGAVLRDLAGIQKYLKSEPRLSSHEPNVRQTIDAIQSGRITVKSDAEKHCSGG